MRSWSGLNKHDMEPVVNVGKASLKGILCVTRVLPRIRMSVKNKKKEVRGFYFSLFFGEMPFMGEEKEF